MPKIKTHKGAAKRFKVTASGLLKRKRRQHAHKLSKQTRKRKRNNIRTHYADPADAPGIKRLIPYNV